MVSKTVIKIHYILENASKYIILHFKIYRKEKEISNFISALDHTLNMNNRRSSATDDKSEDESIENDEPLVDEADAVAGEEVDEVITLVF